MKPSFRHLRAGDTVRVQFVRQGAREEAPDEHVVIATFDGMITRAGTSRLDLDVYDCQRFMATPDATYWTVQSAVQTRLQCQVSKATGEEWGEAYDEGYFRIDPSDKR